MQASQLGKISSAIIIRKGVTVRVIWHVTNFISLYGENIEKTDAYMTKSLRLIKLLTRNGETILRLTRATAAPNNCRGIYRQTIHRVNVLI